AEAEQGEIVGRPTMLVKYEGRLNAEQILNTLKQINYPLEDVSVLFRVEGGDQVVDLITGHVAAGQSLTDAAAHKKAENQNGQTVVLLHPTPAQAAAVRKALVEVGAADIEYAGETRAHGRPGGIDRHDEHVT